MEKGVKVVGKISLVEQALAKHATLPTADAIKKALELKKAQDEERDSKRILEALRKVDNNTAEAVRALQNVRAIEKATKQYLKDIAEAEQEFIKTADFDAYNKALSNANNKAYQNGASRSCSGYTTI